MATDPAPEAFQRRRKGGAPREPRWAWPLPAAHHCSAATSAWKKTEREKKEIRPMVAGQALAPGHSLGS